jgi:hypothetical protein
MGLILGVASALQPGQQKGLLLLKRGKENTVGRVAGNSRLGCHCVRFWWGLSSSWPAEDHLLTVSSRLQRDRKGEEEEEEEGKEEEREMERENSC